MGRKKNLKLNPEEEQLVYEKMGGSYENRYDTILPCSSALNYKVDLKCKNQKQKEYYRMIKDKEIVFCAGSAGSGKSYVCLAAALELLKDPTMPYRNILLIVPTVQSDLEVGFLKGTLEEKMEPHLQPAWYNIEKILKNSGNQKPSNQILDELKKCKFITANCVSFLRGVNIDNSIVIIEEAQQFPKSAMKTILTRIGENSKYIFNGDYDQCDNKDIKKSKETNGLKHVIDKYKDLDEVGTIEFNNEDIVRNPIISKLLEKFD